MRIVTRPELWWRVLVVLAVSAGFLTGTHQIAYYTSQSNLFVLGYFGAALYWMIRRRSPAAPAPRLRGAVTLWIVITGLISHFLLENGASPLPGLVAGDPWERLANWSLFFLHYVSPAMVLLDWVLFGPRRRVRWRDLWLWLIYPFAYGVGYTFRALLLPWVPARYPYFFLDPGQVGGYGGLVVYMLVLLVVFGAFGAALIGIDRLAARLGRTPAPAPAPEPEQRQPETERV